MQYTRGPLVVRKMTVKGDEAVCVYSPSENRIVAVTGQPGDARSLADAVLFSLANDLAEACRSILHQFGTDLDLDLCVSNPGIYDQFETSLRDILFEIDSLCRAETNSTGQPDG